MDCVCISDQSFKPNTDIHFLLEGKFQLPIEVFDEEGIQEAFREVTDFLEANRLIFVANLPDNYRLLITSDCPSPPRYASLLSKHGANIKRPIATKLYFSYNGPSNAERPLVTPAIEMIDRINLAESQNVTTSSLNVDWCVSVKGEQMKNEPYLFN